MSTETEPRFMQLHRVFAETEYGQALAARVRYEVYKPPDVSNQTWIDMFGADVNNLNHMPLTWGLARSLIRRLEIAQPGFLNPHEAEVVQTAAMVHDWGEAIVGDITYSQKNDQDEAAEQDALDKILVQLPTGANEFRSNIAEALSSVIFETDGKLGRVFNAVERVGYIRTGLRASHHITGGQVPECEPGLRWMVADILGNHIVPTIRHAWEIMPVDDYLTDQQFNISQALVQVRPQEFANYSAEMQVTKQTAFAQAERAWLSYAHGFDV